MARNGKAKTTTMLVGENCVTWASGRVKLDWQGPAQTLLVAMLISIGMVNADAQDHEATLQDLEKQFTTAAAAYIPESIDLQFRANSSSFGHLRRPWATREQNSAGSFAIRPSTFLLSESKSRGTVAVEKKTSYSAETLFQCDGEEQPLNVSINDHQAYLRLSCRFSPAILLGHAIASRKAAKSSQLIEAPTIRAEGEALVVSGLHGDENYEIHFRNKSMLERIVWYRAHEMWGDQTIEYSYSDQKPLGEWMVPRVVTECTFETQTFETVVLGEAATDLAVPVPEQHRLTESQQTSSPIEIEEYSNHVTFLHLPDCDSRTTLIEFRDFLMVIDAPISSENGQLILDKIGQLKREKPVKYFAFGHHHPHYLGGVRVFIAAGATVLTTKKIASYVSQLAEFPHSRKPDALARNPRDVSLEVFEDQTVITDGDYSVKVFDIGEKSLHTNDYLLFYFPEEKLILQDDGIWLRPNSPLSERTRATYAAIEQLGVNVVDCIQSWPTQNYGVSTKIKYSDLKDAISR